MIFVEEDNKETGIAIEIVSRTEFIEMYSTLPHSQEILHTQNIRYCKAICYPNCIIGDMTILDTKYETLHKNGFSFYATKKKLIFIDSYHFVDKNLTIMEEKEALQKNSTGQLLHDFLYFLILDDSIYLQTLEDMLTDIEEKLMEVPSRTYHEQLLQIRKKLMILNSYYHQLDDFVSILSENETNFFNTLECRAFKIQLQRIERIYDHIFSLREYSLQIKEVYQAQIDARQNTIMKVLTVATSIFFPLSIITGWYGMNFKNMPELSMPYGYVIVIILSVLIISIELLVLKWKKYL